MKEIEKKSSKPNQCPVTYCMRMIGGKWKPIILFLISKGVNRFGELHRNIEGISKQMLTKQLREMERRDGILERVIYAEIPPRVEYFLTDFGKSLFPIIESMRDWGEHHMASVEVGNEK
ncbi:MAG: helix-turn-helix domain-containing protein [Bacteroidota bacterium]